MTTATMPSTNNIKPVKRTWFKVQAATVLSLLLATCTSPSYATVNKCTNYIDLVAVHSNNATQEPRKLPVTVEHRTIADVFLCLSFIGLSFIGKLRLALVRLWWGGHGNKPFIRQIPCAVLQRFSSLPAALNLGQSSLIPLEKVL